NWEQAYTNYVQAAMGLRQVGVSYASTYPPLFLGLLHLGRGAWEAAAQPLDEARRLAEQGDDHQALRWDGQALAECDVLAGRAGSARERLDPLLEGSAREGGQALYLLAYLAWANGELGEQALAEVQVSEVSEAIDRARASGIHLALVEALRIQAQ